MKTSKRKKILKMAFFFLKKDNFETLYKRIDQLSYQSFWYKGVKKYDIIIFDNVLPNLSTPWRSFELENLILKFPNSKVISNNRSKAFNSYIKFNKRKKDFGIFFPILSKRLTKEKLICNVNTKVLYFLFFNNIVFYYEKIKINNISFVFTLYPGGGWELNNKTKDKIITEIVSDELCLGVIVNQFITFEYLVGKLKISEKKIKLIHGIPVNLESRNVLRKYNSRKEAFNIVFVGHKYTNLGEDKGLPIFLDVINRINQKGFNIKGYIVGNFKKENFEPFFDLSEIRFMGEMKENQLLLFLQTTDIILSCNKPFVLSRGAYDGFPLGSVGMAAMSGNLVLSTDYFNEGSKIGFIDNVHFIKIDTEVNHLIEKLKYCLINFEKMNEIINESLRFFINYYSFKNQINPRLEMFEYFVNRK